MAQGSKKLNSKRVGLKKDKHKTKKQNIRKGGKLSLKQSYLTVLSHVFAAHDITSFSHYLVITFVLMNFASI